MKKFAKESFALSTHIVLPNDTNTLGNLMGGQLLKWMDITGAISAHRHCKKAVVTASVGNVSFQKPIKFIFINFITPNFINGSNIYYYFYSFSINFSTFFCNYIKYN